MNISSIRFQPTSAQVSKEASSQMAPSTDQRPVVDNYHGQDVVDKFRWLEDGTSQEVKDWTKAQNAYTAAKLETVPERAQVVERLGELFSGKNVETPYTVGGREFLYKREAGKISPLCTRRTMRESLRSF